MHKNTSPSTSSEHVLLTRQEKMDLYKLYPLLIGLLDHNFQRVDRLENSNQKAVEAQFRHFLRIHQHFLQRIEATMKGFCEKDHGALEEALLAWDYETHQDTHFEINPPAQKMLTTIQCIQAQHNLFLGYSYLTFPPVWLWTPLGGHDLSTLEHDILDDRCYSRNGYAKGEYITKWIKSDKRTSHRLILAVKNDQLYVTYWFLMREGKNKFDGTVTLTRDTCEVSHVEYHIPFSLHALRHPSPEDLQNYYAPFVELCSKSYFNSGERYIIFNRGGQQLWKSEAKKPIMIKKEHALLHGGETVQHVVDFLAAHWDDLLLVYYDLSDRYGKPLMLKQ